jgi:hypothetical protein
MDRHPSTALSKVYPAHLRRCMGRNRYKIGGGHSPTPIVMFPDQTKSGREDLRPAEVPVGNLRPLEPHPHQTRSGREDLNLRPLEPHSSALPGCATPRTCVSILKLARYANAPRSKASSTAQARSQTRTGRIQHPIRNQLHTVGDQEPDQSVCPNDQRPLPSDRSHEDTEDR